ncbi:MAG: CrcB family protein [Akkermansia sp.]
MNTLSKLLLIFLGGGLGSALRWGIDTWVMRIWKHSPWPMGVFIINMTGCLLMGILAGLLLRDKGEHAWMWPLLATGFLGGFTTFSTYCLNVIQCHLEGHTTMGIIYALLSLILGITLAMGGYLLMIRH